MRSKLFERRNELGLTQEEAAKLIGIARTTYAMIEQNKRKPSIAVAKRIEKALGVDWVSFFEE